MGLRDSDLDLESTGWGVDNLKKFLAEEKPRCFQSQLQSSKAYFRTDNLKAFSEGEKPRERVLRTRRDVYGFRFRVLGFRWVSGFGFRVGGWGIEVRDQDSGI